MQLAKFKTQAGRTNKSFVGKRRHDILFPLHLLNHFLSQCRKEVDSAVLDTISQVFSEAVQSLKLSTDFYEGFTKVDFYRATKHTA